MASNAETNIAKALELKAQGNEAFKAADYKQAMVHYHQARYLPACPTAADARRQHDTRARTPVAAPPPRRLATRAACGPAHRSPACTPRAPLPA